MCGNLNPLRVLVYMHAQHPTTFVVFLSIAFATLYRFGAIDKLMKLYARMLPALGGYLCEGADFCSEMTIINLHFVYIPTRALWHMNMRMGPRRTWHEYVPMDTLDVRVGPCSLRRC